jgi:hypothetical protein
MHQHVVIEGQESTEKEVLKVKYFTLEIFLKQEMF